MGPFDEGTVTTELPAGVDRPTPERLGPIEDAFDRDRRDGPFAERPADSHSVEQRSGRYMDVRAGKRRGSPADVGEDILICGAEQDSSVAGGEPGEHRINRVGRLEIEDDRKVLWKYLEGGIERRDAPIGEEFGGVSINPAEQPKWPEPGVVDEDGLATRTATDVEFDRVGPRNRPTDGTQGIFGEFGREAPVCDQSGA